MQSSFDEHYREPLYLSGFLGRMYGKIPILNTVDTKELGYVDSKSNDLVQGGALVVADNQTPQDIHLPAQIRVTGTYLIQIGNIQYENVDSVDRPTLLPISPDPPLDYLQVD